VRKEEVERMRWFWFVGIGVVLIVAVVSGFWLLGSLGEDPAVLISGFYDADGNPIGSGTSEAVVGGVEGVAFLNGKASLRDVGVAGIPGNLGVVASAVAGKLGQIEIVGGGGTLGDVAGGTGPIGVGGVAAKGAAGFKSGSDGGKSRRRIKYKDERK